MSKVPSGQHEVWMYADEIRSVTATGRDEEEAYFRCLAQFRVNFGPANPIVPPSTSQVARTRRRLKDVRVYKDTDKPYLAGKV